MFLLYQAVAILSFFCSLLLSKGVTTLYQCKYWPKCQSLGQNDQWAVSLTTPFACVQAIIYFFAALFSNCPAVYVLCLVFKLTSWCLFFSILFLFLLLAGHLVILSSGVFFFFFKAHSFYILFYVHHWNILYFCGIRVATMSSIRYFENHVSYFVQTRRK